MQYRACFVLLLWISFAPAAAQKTTGALLDYEPDTIEAGVMRPELDGELLFPGMMTPRLAPAKTAWDALTRVGQAAELQAAVTAIKGLDPTRKDLPWAVAYVAAWVRLRQGDFAGAAKAMDAVLARWTLKAAFQSVCRELLMMHALAGSDVNQALAALGNAKPMTPLLIMLADAYDQAGDEPRRLAALKRAENGADNNELTTIRALEFDTELQLDHPDRVVTLLRAQLVQATAELVDRASAYQRLFADTRDERHRAAASEIYATLLAPTAAALLTQQARVAALATARLSAPAHLAARRFIRLHTSEVTGCYRRLLQTDPTLEGKLVLRFLVDNNGAVTNATATAERPAVIGLAALGRCVQKQVSTWRFPRSAPTTVIQPFTFRANE